MKKVCCIGAFSFLCAAAVCGQERGEEVDVLMKQSETIADCWTQIRQLEKQVRETEQRIDSLSKVWKKVCDGYLSSGYQTREGLEKLLQQTNKDIDGEDLYRRLEEALENAPEGEGGSMPSPVRKDERKPEPEKEPEEEDSGNELKSPERERRGGKDGSGFPAGSLEEKTKGGQKK